MLQIRLSLHLLVLLFIISITTSCNKEVNDENRPSITNLSLDLASVPAEAGGVLNLSARLSDDVDLATLFIEIGSDGTGGNWTVNRRLDLSGEEQLINESFSIPANTNEGQYHFTLRLLDEAGNFTTSKSPSFGVINHLKPVVNLILHPVQEGDTLFLRGTVRDDVDLATVSVVVHIPPGYSGNQLFFNELINVEGSSDTLWDIEKDGRISIYFPNYAKGGDYSLRFSAIDNEGNVRVVAEKVRI